MPQLTINFDAGLADSYKTAREFVAARVHQIGKLQKVIAADLDLSPSHLSRKLAQSPDDRMRFTLDDFERYIETQGDVQPIYYLIEKYLTRDEQIAQLEKQLAELKAERGL